MSSPSALSSPPFIAVEGVINVRTIGGYRTDASHIVDPKLVFRSGEVSGITETGKQQLVALGIHRVFDMRTNLEINSYKTPRPNIPGVEFVPVPVGKEDPWEAGSIEERYGCCYSSRAEAPNYISRLKHFQENELEVRQGPEFPISDVC